MKTQAYYDKKYLQPELVGDEMTLPELIAWIVVIGCFIGWVFAEFLTGPVVK